MKEKYYKPFGPTIGKYNLSNKLTDKVNYYANKIIEKYTSNLPSSVSLKLPKLKKLNKQKSSPVKLPKLKRV